eukprot:Gb_18911 [translate_table: standard]
MFVFELWFTAAYQSSSVWTVLNLDSLQRRMSVYLLPPTRFKFAQKTCVDFSSSIDEVGVLPRR